MYVTRAGTVHAREVAGKTIIIFYRFEKKTDCRIIGETRVINYYQKQLRYKNNARSGTSRFRDRYYLFTLFKTCNAEQLSVVQKLLYEQNSYNQY